MVYAVWVVRRDFALRQPEVTRQVQQRLRQAFDYGLAHLEEACRWMRRGDFTPQQLRHYLSLLNYDLTPRHQEALLGFYRRAKELELIERVPALAFAGGQP